MSKETTDKKAQKKVKISTCSDVRRVGTNGIKMLIVGGGVSH